MSEELTAFISTFEAALREYIDTERARVEGERDFLLAVLDGRTDGITIEDVSTDLTKLYLSGYFGEYIGIEQDLSGE